MKKTIIILSLIYFISCSSLCEDDENLPTQKEDCYDRETSLSEKECCYGYIDVTIFNQTKQIKTCFESELGADLEEEKKKQLKK